MAGGSSEIMNQPIRTKAEAINYLKELQVDVQHSIDQLEAIDGDLKPLTQQEFLNWQRDYGMFDVIALRFGIRKVR